MAESCKTDCPLQRECETIKKSFLSVPDNIDISMEDLTDTIRGIDDYEKAQLHCDGRKARIMGYIIHAVGAMAYLRGSAVIIPHLDDVSLADRFPRCLSHEAQVAIAGMPDTLPEVQPRKNIS